MRDCTCKAKDMPFGRCCKATPAPVVHERDIEKHLVAQVKKLGGEVRKLKWIGRTSAPDRVVFIAGRPPIFVELKAPGKTSTAAQLREHQRMRENGAKVVVLDSTANVDKFIWLGGEKL